MKLRFWHAVARIFGFASGYLGVVSDWGWDHYNAIRYPEPAYVAPPPPPERIIIPSDTPLPKTPIVVEGEVINDILDQPVPGTWTYSRTPDGDWGPARPMTEREVRDALASEK